MAQVEQDCVSDIIELLLENPQLFSHSEVNALSTINAQLKVSIHCVCVCMCDCLIIDVG